MRGDVHRLHAPRGARDNEQTQVLIEQTAAVAPERLGELAGHVSLTELQTIDAALRLALEID